MERYGLVHFELVHFELVHFELVHFEPGPNRQIAPRVNYSGVALKMTFQ
jgi:hypothetical protein